MAHLLFQRTREIGVRTILGARAGDIVRLVPRDATRLVLIGLARGAARALLMTKVLESQLFGVAPTDRLTFATIAAVISLVALLANYVQARSE